MPSDWNHAALKSPFVMVHALTTCAATAGQIASTVILRSWRSATRIGGMTMSDYGDLVSTIRQYKLLASSVEMSVTGVESNPVAGTYKEVRRPLIPGTPAHRYYARLKSGYTREATRCERELKRRFGGRKKMFEPRPSDAAEKRIARQYESEWTLPLPFPAVPHVTKNESECVTVDVIRLSAPATPAADVNPPLRAVTPIPAAELPVINLPSATADIHNGSTSALRLMTTGEMATVLNVAAHRVLFVLRTRKIQPASRAEMYRLFDTAAMKQVSAELQRIAAK
jgi:hypothetical protein